MNYTKALILLSSLYIFPIHSMDCEHSAEQDLASYFKKWHTERPVEDDSSDNDSDNSMTPESHTCSCPYVLVQDDGNDVNFKDFDIRAINYADVEVIKKHMDECPSNDMCKARELLDATLSTLIDENIEPMVPVFNLPMYMPAEHRSAENIVKAERWFKRIYTALAVKTSRHLEMTAARKFLEIERETAPSYISIGFFKKESNLSAFKLIYDANKSLLSTKQRNLTNPDYAFHRPLSFLERKRLKFLQMTAKQQSKYQDDETIEEESVDDSYEIFKMGRAEPYTRKMLYKSYRREKQLNEKRANNAEYGLSRKINEHCKSNSTHPEKETLETPRSFFNDLSQQNILKRQITHQPIPVAANLKSTNKESIVFQSNNHSQQLALTCCILLPMMNAKLNN